jgi:hypothetical protein
MAVGTAVKRMDNIKPLSASLLTQAVIKDQQTFFKSVDSSTGVSLNQPTRSTRNSFWVTLIVVIYLVMTVLLKSMKIGAGGSP